MQFVATQGDFPLLTARADDPIVQTQTLVQFDVIPRHNLPTNSLIRVTLPDQFEIASGGCSLTVLDALSPAASCSFDDNQITIEDPFDEAYDPNVHGTIRFKIDKIVMPATAADTEDL